jgi:hypothetical protein
MSERTLTDELYRIFSITARNVADDILRQLAVVQKADGVDTYEIDLSDMDAIATDAVNELESVMAESGRKSILQIGISEQSIFGIINEASHDYAKNRAAEMVGKKWVNGKLVDNPNAEWVITDTSRDSIRSLVERVITGKLRATDLRQAIINAETFSKERAEMITRTELVTANAKGAMRSLFAAEEAGLKVKKIWDSTGEACPICLANTRVGAIDLRAVFPSGHLMPTAHPSCRCTLASEIDYGDEEED